MTGSLDDNSGFQASLPIPDLGSQYSCACSPLPHWITLWESGETHPKSAGNFSLRESKLFINQVIKMKILGAGDQSGVAVMKPDKVRQASPLPGGPDTVPEPNSEVLSLFPERLKHVLGSDCKVPQYKKPISLFPHLQWQVQHSPEAPAERLHVSPDVLVCSGQHSQNTRPGGLNYRHLFAHSSRGQKSKAMFCFWWGLSSWLADMDTFLL